MTINSRKLLLFGMFIISLYCCAEIWVSYGYLRTAPICQHVSSIQHEELRNGGMRNDVPRLLCKDKDLFMLVYVHSSAGNIAQRVVVRTTWGDPSRYPDVPIQVVFMLATPESNDSRKYVQRESEFYQDIIIYPHMESYRNVSLKALAAIRDVARYCQHVPYVLKIDDDVVANVFSVLDFLQHKVDDFLASHLPRPPTPADTLRRGLLMCFVWPESRPFRNPRHKWYVTPEQYPNATYPPFCSGTAWIMSVDTVTALAEASLESPVFPLDDVGLTGILARKKSIALVDLSHQITIYPGKRTVTTDVHIFFHVPDCTHFQTIWHSILAGSKPALRPGKLYLS